jgi:hypothetical protein
MRIQRENVLLRAFFSTIEKRGRRAASESFLARAAEAGCRGATVLVGREGFLGGGPILREKAFTLAHDLPVVVEVIDTPHRIGALLRLAAEDLRGRPVTLEKASILVFRAKGGGAPAPESPAAGTEGAMHREEDGVLLRIFIDESDRHEGRGLSGLLMERAAAAGLDGGIVLRAPEGFGAHHDAHTSRIEATAMDMPLVVEVLGSEEKVRAFLPFLDESVHEGLVTLEKVRLLRYPSL